MILLLLLLYVGRLVEFPEFDTINYNNQSS